MRFKLDRINTELGLNQGNLEFLTTNIHTDNGMFSNFNQSVFEIPVRRNNDTYDFKSAIGV